MRPLNTIQGFGKTALQDSTSNGAASGIALTLLAILALQSAVAPFAIDMYTPAFPGVSADLRTEASLVGLSLTSFFLGMGLGQLIGGPISDQRGRRLPMIIGGLICTLGAVGCALAPSIWVLIACRLAQGVGGGIAGVVARAVVVDLAHGHRLAKMMSILMAIVGLAPMIAPVLGGMILTIGTTWRFIFWCLAGFGLIMLISAWSGVPESLPSEHRRSGGLRRFPATSGQLMKDRQFVGYLLTSSFSAFATMAYITNSSYVLQEMKGLRPLPFAVTFASIALCRTLLSLVNARLVGRFQPQALIRSGLCGTATAVVILAVGTFGFGTPLVVTIIGFLVLMCAQAFVFGNSNALAASRATHVAGSASAVLGVAQAIAGSASAPLASSGGGASAVPMVIVMAAGVTLSAAAFLRLTGPQTNSEQAESDRPPLPAGEDSWDLVEGTNGIVSRST